MTIYSTGAVRMRVGSALVKGTSGTEQFSTYASAGYLFKLTNESTWYQIAAVTNATNLVLSSRYSNSNYQTSRSAEHMATMTDATQMYSGVLKYYPVIQEGVTITASLETFTDNGGGVLVGNASPPGSGTIDYDTGAWAIVLGTDLTATAEMTASYYSGDTRTGLSYQIVTDYTPVYSIPEMSLNDINFQYIYTKGVRIIDSALNSIASQVTTASGIAGLTASINNIQASLNFLSTQVGGNYSASIHELYVDDTNVHASLNSLFIDNTNVHASLNTINLDLDNVHASLNYLYGVVGADYSASVHELYASVNYLQTDSTNIHASLNFLSTQTTTASIAANAEYDVFLGNSNNVFVSDNLATTDFFPSCDPSGWSGTPTGSMNYIRIGKLVFINILITGTGDASGDAYASLPFVAAGVGQNILLKTQDNGATTYETVKAGVAVINAGQKFIRFYPNVTTSVSWTNSNTKSVRGTFFYIAE